VDVITTEGLTKRYGRRVGIEALTLSVPEGSVFGFLGENGAGKTTTIRLLLGFLRPDAGTARAFGMDCWRRSPAVKRRVGYLPGDLRLPAWYDGRSALRVAGLARNEDLRAAGEEIAATFGLDLAVRVREMSRGMRQKLGLVLALAHDPKLLVLDEPTAALDPPNQRRLYELLRARAAAGATVFFSSHVLPEVEELCDRVAILRHGRLLAAETVADLRRRASRRVVVTFAGEAPGEIPGCLDRVDRSGSRIEARLAGPVSDLVAWLNGRPVADLTIGPPDLDRLFRDFYRDAGAAR
jgi:ABC-2 type transport system ATP-binding protein